MLALDTNLLVRLLVNDDAKQAAKVEAWLTANTSPSDPAYIDHIVLSELVWVLESAYQYSRSLIHGAVSALLEQDHFAIESPHIVRQALVYYKTGTADFSDYLLAMRAKSAGYEPVLTLDKKAARTATHRLLD